MWLYCLFVCLFFTINIPAVIAFESSDINYISPLQIKQFPSNSQTKSSNNLASPENINNSDYDNSYTGYDNNPYTEFRVSVTYIIIETYKTGVKIDYNLTDIIINSFSK